MAKFEMQLPNDVLKDFERIYNDTEKIFGDMVKAGADTVMLNIHGSVPPAFRDSEIMHCLKITRVYKTPTDDGINCKVGFYGYFYNKRGIRTPAPLVANVFEYGASHSDWGFPKHPFFRKAFKKSVIEKAMLEAQRTASGGILTDE